MPVTFHALEPDNEADYGVTRNPSVKVSFFTGQAIAVPLPVPLVFEVNYPKGTAPPHFLGDRIPVASRLLWSVLKDAGVHDLQGFSAVLVNPETQEQWTDYVALNVIGLRPAAHLGDSSYDPLMEGDDRGGIPPLLAFDELVLDASKVEGCLMLRLAESPSTLIIRDDVNAYIDAHSPEEGWGFDTIELKEV